MLPKKIRNRKAIALLRVSSKRQEGNNSHQVQEEKVVEYCGEFDLELVDTRRIVESAKRSDLRKKYADAIQTALRNDIYNVLFYMNDREARNLTDNENNERLVKEGKICIHYVNDRKVLHSKSPASDFLMRDFYAVQNKNYSRVLSEKVNDAMRFKAETGCFPGNRPPLGYIHQKIKSACGKEMKRGTVVVPDTNEGNLRWVRREFELRSQGMTIEQIRDRILSENLVPPSKRYSYSVHGVEERLKNKFYWGSFDWQGIEYKGNHDLIIDRQTLQLVKASFGLKGTYNRTKHLQALFSGGWLRCSHPECGLQIVYDPKEKKNKKKGTVRRFEYYRCANSRKLHKSLKYVTEGHLWEQFESALGGLSMTPEMAERVSLALNEYDLAARKNVEVEARRVQVSIAELHEKKDKLMDLYLAGGLDSQEYKRQSQRFQDEITKNEKLLEEIKLSQDDSWKITAQRVFELAINLKSLWKQGSEEERLQILKKLYSNPKLNEKELLLEPRRPFLTLSNIKEKMIEEEVQKKQNPELLDSGLVDKTNWRSQGDLNPCILREREVS
ncbi:resolvase [Bdellovibrio bacteriovorus str. Tiberius]|uniref:Resolvase n=1 Tax=Bdellovibrio bacteriovorus str. Tiberius TaxID=1069642 RepID=K7YWQ2_BDEBC|nr:resolvase [Bdellovibrio bacteriovorus str. Tiberius]